MASQTLLVSQDPQVLATLQPVFAEMSVSAEVCETPETAASMLAAGVFDPIIVDGDELEAAPGLLQEVQSAVAARDAVYVAIVSGFEGMQRAFRLGANLVMWKPVTVDEAERVLRAACDLLSRVRRRFPRLAPRTLAFANIEGIAEDAMILEVGKGGMGVQSMTSLPCGKIVEARFYLPGMQSEIVAKSEVVWSDDAGRTGLRYLSIPGRSRAALDAWMSAHGGNSEAVSRAVPFGSPEMPEVPIRSQRVLAGCLDALLVSLGTLVFDALSRLATAVQPETSTGLLQSVLTFLLFWLAYRSVFFRNVSKTPGALLGSRICDWHLRLLERRRLDNFPSITTLQ